MKRQLAMILLSCASTLTIPYTARAQDTGTQNDEMTPEEHEEACAKARMESRVMYQRLGCTSLGDNEESAPEEPARSPVIKQPAEPEVALTPREEALFKRLGAAEVMAEEAQRDAQRARAEARYARAVAARTCREGPKNAFIGAGTVLAINTLAWGLGSTITRDGEALGASLALGTAVGILPAIRVGAGLSGCNPWHVTTGGALSLGAITSGFIWSSIQTRFASPPE